MHCQILIISIIFFFKLVSCLECSMVISESSFERVERKPVSKFSGSLPSWETPWPILLLQSHHSTILVTKSIVRWNSNKTRHNFFYYLYSPCGPWPLFSLLIYLRAVGLLGRAISSWQGLYLNTGQHKHRINTYTQQTSMPGVGFEPTITASERAKGVHAWSNPRYFRFSRLSEWNCAAAPCISATSSVSHCCGWYVKGARNVLTMNSTTQN
jgi:hypothetical protein